MRKSIWLILITVLAITACNPTSAGEVSQQVETAVPTPTSPPIDTAMPQPTETAVPKPTDTVQPTPTATIAATETVYVEPTEVAPALPRFSVQDRFTIYGDEAAVPHGDEQFTDPGAVVFYDGQFHMFYNAFTGWPTSVDIVYAISDDGINWTQVQDEPVLTSSDVSFAGIAALASSALVLEDGTWVLYFYTWDDPSWPASASSIGMATAANPQGPWTVADNPVLRPGRSSSWDGEAVRTPSVVQTEDGFVMFYAGYSTSKSAIGQATSANGLTWTKYDDPTTEEALYAKSDPIFDGSGEAIWDKSNVFQPHVQLTPEGWVMLYASATNVTSTPVNNRHGIAVSRDGFDWVRSDTPIFSPNDVRSGSGNIWFAELIYAQDSYFVYIEAERGNNTEVYVATLAEMLIDE